MERYDVCVCVCVRARARVCVSLNSQKRKFESNLREMVKHDKCEIVGFRRG
jgi:hypothetical protein